MVVRTVVVYTLPVSDWMMIEGSDVSFFKRKTLAKKLHFNSWKRCVLSESVQKRL